MIFGIACFLTLMLVILMLLGASTGQRLTLDNNTNPDSCSLLFLQAA